MSAFVIDGGNRLYGDITVQGAKNSILPLLSATVLCKGECVIHNCPNLTDVEAAIDILKYLGCYVKKQNNTIIVNSDNISRCDIPASLMNKMRSSVIFLGALISRCNRAEFSLPGGCAIGKRPIDLHIKAMESLGANFMQDENNMYFDCNKGLKGTVIKLPIRSVGATENALLAAVVANGTTNIINCAKEPEVQDLADFLNKCGAKISGIGTNCLTVEGVERLYSCEYTVIPDRIAAITYLCCAAAAKGNVTLKKVNYNHIKFVTDILSAMGCVIIYNNDTITIRVEKRLKSFDFIKTDTYPYFPTDAQALLMAVSCYSIGESLFVENIFENRFRHITEFCKMGADICVLKNIALINGVSTLKGSGELYAKDLRGGAGIVVAALGADGVSTVNNVNYIDRGYENIENTLTQLGAKIRRA